ncbi:sulfotransferase [Okeania sp. SIO2B3]|uniref:sulfotransferase n=1 Tax=Okeania sp. SIO2B3 TaxID=2607784 RepID=UPI0013BF26F9|nr:sulfotransferase [Okeania sp. SIO2B3]NET45681.1 hypothetical protein [Okeania sp. SIO2B3]
MNKILVIFSVPRTGSNFLCNIINSFREFECFGEVYHNKKVFAPDKRKLELITYLTQVKGVKKISIEKHNDEDLELVKYAHQYPDLFLESMQQTSQKKYLGFKIFQYHLSVENIQKFFIDNRNVIKLVLKRNLLDVYASGRILNENMKKIGGNAAHHLDTSTDKVIFEEKHFSNWLRRTIKYYSMFEYIYHQFPKEYLFIKYEDIHRYKNNQDKALYLINSLNDMGFKIDDKQDLDNLSFLKKQDSRAFVLEKFKNPEAVKEFLFQNDLKNLLNN